MMADTSRPGSETGRSQVGNTVLVHVGLHKTGTTWLQLRFQPKVEPTRAALIYTTEPVFAALFSWLLFAERLPATGWLGGGLIVLGMVLAETAGRSPANAHEVTSPGRS